MTDDPIRDLLATVATHSMGSPPGYVAAPFGHIEAKGGDVEVVRAWVEAHGGRVDYPAPPESSAVNPQPRAVTDRRRFVIQTSALGL